MAGLPGQFEATGTQERARDVSKPGRGNLFGGMDYYTMHFGATKRLLWVDQSIWSDGREIREKCILICICLHHRDS